MPSALALGPLIEDLCNLNLMNYLAFRFIQVAAFPTKKTPAEKSYVSALCRILVLLQFRSSEQEAIQLMRRLLNPVAESVSAEKDLVKELKRMADRLKALDKHPDQEMSQDQANLIFGKSLLCFFFIIFFRITDLFMY